MLAGDSPRRIRRPTSSVGGEDASYEQARHAGGERHALEVARVGPTEHDRNTWCEGVTVLAEKGDRGPHHADDEIQLFGTVLLQEVVTQRQVILLFWELGRVHRFGEELDAVSAFGTQRRPNRLVEDRQARERSVFVEEQEYARVLALACRGSGRCGQRSEHAEADHEA